MCKRNLGWIGVLVLALVCNAGADWSIETPSAGTKIKSKQTFSTSGDKPAKMAGSVVLNKKISSTMLELITSHAIGDFEAEYEGESWAAEFDPDGDLGEEGEWPVTDPGDTSLWLEIPNESVGIAMECEASA